MITDYSSVALSDFIVSDDLHCFGNSKVFLSDGYIDDNLHIGGNSSVTLNNVGQGGHGGSLWGSGNSIIDAFGTTNIIHDLIVIDNSIANLYGGSYNDVSVYNYFPDINDEPQPQNGILNIYGYDLKWENSPYGGSAQTVTGFWGDGTPINIGSVSGDRVNLIGVVPEPATMLLLGSGLVGLAVIGRKRFKKK